MDRPTLRRGSIGPAVRDLQRALAARGHVVAVDGDFGPRTEDALVDAQRAMGLLPDGVAGPLTWAALDAPVVPESAASRWLRVYGFTPVTLPDGSPHGYTRATLGARTAAKWLDAVEIVAALGGRLTTAGGRRALGVSGANRAMMSLHKTGRALDLALYSAGGRDPSSQPILLEGPDAGPWRVLVRVERDAPDYPTPAWDVARWAPVDREVSAWRRGMPPLLTRATVVDLTAAMAAVDVHRIPPRASWRRGDYGGAEWWHMQDVEGLVVGETTYGEALSEVWSAAELAHSEEWRVGARWRWTGVGFAP